MAQSKKPILTAIIGLAWLFGLIVLYFAGHKPFGSQLALALARAAWELIVALAIASLAGGLGRRLLPAEDLPPLARMAVQAGLGLGLLALFILAAGLLGGLRLWLLALCLVGGLAFLARSALTWWQQVSDAGRSWREGDGYPGQGYVRALMALIAALLAAALLTALAPPYHFDALMYHLTLPEAYLRLGRVAYLPWLIRSGMPQNAEMLYTWAMSLGGSQAAAVLGWTFAPLVVLGLASWLEERWDNRAAWTGAAALLAGSSVASAVGWAYADWLGLYFGLCFLIVLDRWRVSAGRRDLLLAGAFGGLAMGCKYTGGALLAAGAAVILFQSYIPWLKRRPLRAVIGDLLAFGLAGAALVAPWLIKNAVTTGNPFYPTLFTSGELDAGRLYVFQTAAPWGNWLDFFLLPLRATYLGVEGADGYGAAVGALLVGLGALAWVGSARRSAQQKDSLRLVAIVAVLGLVIWAAGNRLNGFLIQTRLYYPFFPAFAALAAAGFWGLSSLSIPQVRIGRIVSALVLLALGLNVLSLGAGSLQQGAPQVFLGLETPTDYLNANLGWYYPAVQAVNALPQGSRTLMIYETRSLYCAPNCVPDEILDRWQRDYDAYHDFSAIRQAWLSQGYTHLLVYRAGIEFMKEDDDPHHSPAVLQALDAFLQTLPAPQRFGGAYELYALQ